MNKKRISAAKLFLRYAYPCTETRSNLGLISSEDSQEVEALINDSGNPAFDLLERCFPRVIDSFKAFISTDISNVESWTIRKVRKLWHQHEGPTPVMWGRVESVDTVHVVVDVIGDNKKRVINRYGLSIKPGDLVYFHISTIAEVVKRKKRSTSSH